MEHIYLIRSCIEILARGIRIDTADRHTGTVSYRLIQNYKVNILGGLMIQKNITKQHFQLFFHLK